MGRKKELLKNTAIIFIGKACTQLISVLLLPLYTKYLITEEYGIVDLVITYISLFVPVLSLELEMATFRFLIDNRDNQEEIKKIISTVFRILTIIAIVASIIYILVSTFVNIKYKYLIACVIFVYFYSQFLLQVTRGLGKNLDYSIGCCISGIATVVLNVVLIVFLGFKADGMLWSMIISHIVMMIYLSIKLKMKQYISFHYYDKSLLKKLLRYSLPLIPNGISWWVVNASDRTIISIALSVAANGIYAVSNKFSSLFIGAFNVFQLSWSESASLHINDNDREEFFSNIFNSILKLFTCICILVIAAMPIVFLLFIDEKYFDAFNYVPILMIAMLFDIVVGLYAGLYIAKKMTKQVMNTSIISAIINIFINVLLIKHIGLYAASISTLIAYATMAIYRHFSFQKIFKIKLDKNFIILSSFIIVAICFCYYQKNVYTNILMIVIALIFLFINLKKMMPEILKIMKSRKDKVNRSKI